MQTIHNRPAPAVHPTWTRASLVQARQRLAKLTLSGIEAGVGAVVGGCEGS